MKCDSADRNGIAFCRRTHANSYDAISMNFAILGASLKRHEFQGMASMKISRLSPIPRWLIFSPLVMAVVFGAVLRFTFAPQSPEPANATVPSTQQNDTAGEPFGSPIGLLAKQVQSSAQPHDLLPSSKIETPLPQTGSTTSPSKSTGRRDPFAPVAQAIFKPQSLRPQKASNQASDPTTEAGIALPTSPQSPLLPITPIAGIAPTLPPVPAIELSPVLSPRPTTSVVTPQPGSPTPQQATLVHPVQAIELTGVIHIGDRVGIITRESNTSASRHAFTGDYLLGGQVLIKSIDVSTQEPLVIFEYQGQEFPRMVGSGGEVSAS